jgi:aminopeptidase N
MKPFATAFLGSCVCCLLVASSAAAQRLPGGATPEHYQLWFAPDFKTDTFRGRATIDVTLEKPSPRVTLHAAELTFQEVRITAGKVTQRATVSMHPNAEAATLTVPKPMPAGPIQIAITYTGILNDKLRGFYLSKANGRKYAVSQMEATDARRAFPSFDEPAYKATFDISLMVDNGETAISNGPQKSDTPGPEPGKHTVTFGTTKKMSTYLVALLVGDFACREGKADDIPIRVCSTPDKKDLTGYALEATEQQLAFYNDYYGVKYPFEKLDVIGIPDFAAGAMENTGAITFREQYLLADPKTASLDTKKTVAGVLSHEIAHQWFGDLVTMKWWDDIWLNEGFATWMANKPLAVTHPEWHVELDEVEETQKALALDALRSTRAVRTKVETPDEINEVFDPIAYEKSAGVLRMVESFVGKDAFRKGVASYINKHSYSNATAENFCTEVTSVTSKPVDRIMKSYVDQPGVPVLAVTSACTGSTTEVTIRQERFFGTPGAKPTTAQAWAIPICFKAFPDSPATCHVISKPTETLSVPGCAAEAFVNAGSVGYFFTEYTPETVRALSRKARGTLTPTERVGLIGDEWWMVRAGRHDIPVFLDLAGALASDDTAAVTDALTGRIGFTAEYLVSKEHRPKFEGWVRGRFGPVLESLGLPGDSKDELQQSRRAALLQLVGVWGAAPNVQQRARELALAYLADPSTLPATLAPGVLSVAAYAGDAGLYDKYLARMKEVISDPEAYYRFMNALPSFREPALVKRTLALTLSGDIRSQDSAVLLAGVLAQPWARDVAWAFVKAEWDKLVERHGVFQGIPIIVSATGSFCSTQAAADVKSFFAEHPVPPAERGIRQAIERIESCAAVHARQSEPLNRWLADLIMRAE